MGAGKKQTSIDDLIVLDAADKKLIAEALKLLENKHRDNLLFGEDASVIPFYTSDMDEAAEMMCRAIHKLVTEKADKIAELSDKLRLDDLFGSKIYVDKK